MELENEIHYMNRPLGQALMFLSQGKTNRTSRFARRVYELHKKMEISIEAAWHKSLEEFRSQWPIQRDEWDLLFCIGEVLGKTDRESQSSHNTTHNTSPFFLKHYIVSHHYSCTSS
jgi:stage III sporulation protein AB